MEEWRVIKSLVWPNKMRLMHRCTTNFSKDNIYGWHTCSWWKETEWFCPMCCSVAPEEIQFCADLAGCIRLLDVGGSAGCP